MTRPDPQFAGPEYNTPAVLNVAVMISGYCGRSSFDGAFQACAHDHRGEAVALVRSVMQTEGVKMLYDFLGQRDVTAAVQAKRDELIEAAEQIPTR